MTSRTDELIAIARRLHGDLGDSFTMEQLAREAGLSRATLYRLVGSLELGMPVPPGGCVVADVFREHVATASLDGSPSVRRPTGRPSSPRWFAS